MNKLDLRTYKNIWLIGYKMRDKVEEVRQDEEGKEEK